MERVAFLVEENNRRIDCLLNPEHVEVKRRAGVERNLSHGGLVTGTALGDDPLHFTGGGETEITMNLLFDTMLVEQPVAEGAVPVEDARQLTAPLWLLSENQHQPNRFGRLNSVRLIWGKAWNVRGVIASVAERLERFDVAGRPSRAWLRLQMLRIPESEEITQGEVVPPDAETPSDLEAADMSLVHAPAEVPDAPLASGRADEVAARYYGDPSRWRLVAWANDIDDPSRVEPGRSLIIPSKGDTL
ncbi:MAG: hypothetical protein AAF513_00875 [Pseudomonadota bacterium]